MKTINVAAAIICSGEKILATQRAKGEFAGGWEFPGGKIELGETPEQAAIREIKEELDVEIKVIEHVYTVEYDYPHFHLTMPCFFAEVVSGEIKLLEHSQSKWLGKDELDSVNWLDADVELIKYLKQTL